MYAVEDATLQQARAIVSALARELTTQGHSGSKVPVALRELVRSAAGDLPAGGEADFVSNLAVDLGRLFPIEEMFPRKRRTGR